jgi:ferredoxin
LKSRVDYCREFLREIGLPPETVRLFEPGEPVESPSAEPLFPVSGENGNGTERAQAVLRFSPPGAAEAILGLARRCRVPFDLALDHPGSPLGVVEAGEGCTSCGACVAACPANALSLDRENEGITLTFHALSCVGCGNCVPVCPEKVMNVGKRTDISILAQGEKPLHHDTAPRCVNCGEPVASQAMLDHITSLLGDSPVSSTLRKYCLECRKTIF